MATKKKLLQAAAGSAGGEALNVEEVFSTYLYTGNSSTQTITNGIDLSGEGGLVWIKNRTDNDWHVLNDTERGANSNLYSNETNAASASSPATVSAFNVDGFILNSHHSVNETNYTYASWTFRKAPKFFDVVTYTGNGVAGRTVSHNLGSVPGCIIVKEYGASGEQWSVYHRGIGETQNIYLSLNFAASSSINHWNNTAPTDSVFTLGDEAGVNGNGKSFVAYLFAHNDGDGEFGPDGDADIIKCGSYTGGVSVREVNLGFEPQWVLIKNTTTSGSNWHIVDNMRGAAETGNKFLYPNLTSTEVSDGAAVTFKPTGFNANGGVTWHINDSSSSSQNYMYIAIRRGPMAVPTDATEVFDVAFDGATDNKKPYIRSNTGVVDLLIANSRTGTTYHRPVTRLTSGRYLQTTSTAAEVTQADWKFDFQNGVYDLAASSVNTNGISWMWKRAPSFCDIVCYTGNGTAGRTVSHNLGVAPEMMWIKNRDASRNWDVYHKDLGGTKLLYLNGTNAAITESNIFNNTDPTESVFTLGTNRDVNSSISEHHIAYLFASLDGVSKVGSFTYAGTTLNVDCGFSAGARFVLYKRYNTTGSWLVLDSERGINASANDPVLYLNATDAEDSGYNLIEPYSAGFTITGNDVGNGDYIFYAIA